MPSGVYERKNLNTYTVYDTRTDFLVIIGGTARECAAAMGISLSSFHTTFTKAKNGNPNRSRRWEIFRDDPEDMEIADEEEL